MMITVGNVVFTCAVEEGCNLTITQQPLSGDYVATWTGGEVTAAAVPAPEPDPMGMVSLPERSSVAVGSQTIAAGATITVGNTEFTCAAGDASCTLTITQEQLSGDYVATWTGGMVSAMLRRGTVDDLPAHHTLMAGSHELDAGESMTVGGVIFMCEAGGADCTVDIDAMGMASWLGGEVSASPAPVEVFLPTGYARHAEQLGVPGSLTAGPTTVVIPAGGMLNRGGVTFRNTSTEEASTVVLKQQGLGGPLVYEYTGGIVEAGLLEVVGGAAVYKALQGEAGLTSVRAVLGTPRSADTADTPDVMDLQEVVFHEAATSDDDADAFGLNTPLVPDTAGVTMSVTTHDQGGLIFGDGINDVRVSAASKVTPERGMMPFKGCDMNMPSCDNAVSKRGPARAGSFNVKANWNDNLNASEVWTTGDTTATGTSHGIFTTANQEVTAEGTGRRIAVDVYSDIDLQNAVLAPVAYVMDDADTDPDESVVTELSDEAADVLGLEAGRTGAAAKGQLNNAADGDWEHVRFVNSQFNPGSTVADLIPGDLENFAQDEYAPGAFMRVPGTFVCSTGPCTIDYRGTDGTGNHVVTRGGTWTFRPHGASWVYTPDTDWLAVGVWATHPDHPLGDPEFGAFVYGSDPFTVDDIQGLEGEATYNGNAVGRYAEKNGHALSAGRFNADVTLTADFGDGGANGTISGKVGNFMTGGQARTDWGLNLEEADIQNATAPGDATATPPTPATTANSFSGQASGFVEGGRGLYGFWNGRFYGNNGNEAISDALTAAEDALAELESEDEGFDDATMLVADLTAQQGRPGAAAGTFTATDRVGTDEYTVTLGGAFGANQIVNPPEE
jgi:hypothetical protein